MTYIIELVAVALEGRGGPNLSEKGEKTDTKGLVALSGARTAAIVVCDHTVPSRQCAGNARYTAMAYAVDLVLQIVPPFCIHSILCEADSRRAGRKRLR